MRLRGSLALLCAMTITAGVVTVVTRQQTERIKAPIVQIESTGDGYRLQWSNPNEHFDYSPLRFDIEVLARDGLIQSSFLIPQERTTAPGCCHISLRAGANGTTLLPRMRLPVGWIGFVDVQAGNPYRGPHFPDILCRFGLDGRSACRPLPED